jgi:hypothetical protein
MLSGTNYNMKVSETVEKLNFRIYSRNQGSNREVNGNYTSNLPSDVVGHTVSGNPSVDFICNYKINGILYSFNTLEIKEVVDKVSIGNPSVSRYLKEMIQTNLEELQIGALGYRT